MIVKLLLSHPDIDVNPVNKKGATPVMEATKNGKIESLKVILSVFKCKLNYLMFKGVTGG